MQAILTLALKDLKLLIRDKLGLFWVIVFPLLMALSFGSIFSGSGGGARSLKIATVTDNASPLATKFYEKLGEAEVLKITPLPRDSARLLVARGELTAFVEFTGQGEDVFSLFSGAGGGIEVGIDPSRKAEAGYLNGLINQAYFGMLQGAMTNTREWRGSIDKELSRLDSSSGLDDNQKTALRSFLGNVSTFFGSLNDLDSAGLGNQGASPFGQLDVNFTDVAVTSNTPRTSFEVTFPQSLQWALIGTAAAFGLSIVIERTRGTFMRLRLAPISRAHILAGKGLACFIASVAVCVVLLLIGVLIFKVRIASPLGLAAAVASSALCFVGLMMLMSVMGKTEASVSGAGWAIFLVFSMIGGGMVPLFMMPKWMAALANFSPIKWSILATEGAIWRGFGVAEMLQPIAILLGVGLVGFTIGVMVLSKADQ